MSTTQVMIAILVPTIGISLTFFLTARRKEGLDRRKNVVGGVVMLLCGLIATGAAGLLSSIAPKG